MDEHAHDNYSYDYTVDYQLNLGAWQVTSGSANYSDDWSCHWGYSVSNGTASDSTTETYSEDDFGDSDEDYELDEDNNFSRLTGGNAHISGSGFSHWSHSSNGPYSAGGAGWSVSGEFQQRENDDISWEYGASAEAADGEWTYSGTGSVSYSGSDSYTYSGTGPYSAMGSSGTASYGGHNESAYDFTRYYDMNSSGRWELSGIHRELSGSGFTDWSYSADDDYWSGDTEAGWYTWSASGTQSSGEGHRTDYDYLTTADYEDDNWTYGGHTAQSYDYSSNRSYSANGSYYHAIGTTGTVDEYGESATRLNLRDALDVWF